MNVTCAIYMPLQQAESEETDWELVHSSDEDKASITSHEFGTLPAEASEESISGGQEEYEQEQEGFLTNVAVKKCRKSCWFQGMARANYPRSI